MITDWDDAYDNRGHIPGWQAFPPKWAALAQAFRAAATSDGRAEIDRAYGGQDRERLDIFLPPAPPKGLVVFAHGGYWQVFDKSFWSHLAAGAVARGWAVCVPSYSLAPQACLSQITRQFARAVVHAAERIDGPLRLAGHSAGGHLVCRMVCDDTPLAASLAGRIERVVSISGLHDLRPLLRTRMNGVLKLDEAEAALESAALHHPVEGCSLVCWVGADERPEFIRQSDLLANIWTGLGAATRSVRAPGRHHFTVIEDLAEPDTLLTEVLTG